MRAFETCSYCHGSGTGNMETGSCPWCVGSGRAPVPIRGIGDPDERDALRALLREVLDVEALPSELRARIGVLLFRG